MQEDVIVTSLDGGFRDLLQGLLCILDYGNYSRYTSLLYFAGRELTDFHDLPQGLLREVDQTGCHHLEL